MTQIIKSGYEPNLDEVKADFFGILDKAPWEAYAVRQAVFEGQISGNQYSGDCCCIKGIIAKDLGLPLTEGRMSIFTQTYGIRLGVNSSPLEQYIIVIRPGHTPENNETCRQLLTWLNEYIAGLEAKQAAQVTASVQAGLEEALASAGELPAADQAKLALAQV
jgi:hypothetical protein